VVPSEDELLRLVFVPGRTRPLLGGIVPVVVVCHRRRDLQLGGSAVIIVHNIRSGGRLRHQVLVPGVVIFLVFIQIVFYFTLLLGLGLAQGAAYSFAPAATYASRRVSWHDGDGDEANSRNTEEEVVLSSSSRPWA